MNLLLPDGCQREHSPNGSCEPNAEVSHGPPGSVTRPAWKTRGLHRARFSDGAQRGRSARHYVRTWAAVGLGSTSAWSRAQGPNPVPCLPLSGSDPSVKRTKKKAQKQPRISSTINHSVSNPFNLNAISTSSLFGPPGAVVTSISGPRRTHPQEDDVRNGNLARYNQNPPTFPPDEFQNLL